jgi:hypothetical protein
MHQLTMIPSSCIVYPRDVSTILEGLLSAIEVIFLDDTDNSRYPKDGAVQFLEKLHGQIVGFRLATDELDPNKYTADTLALRISTELHGERSSRLEVAINESNAKLPFYRAVYLNTADEILHVVYGRDLEHTPN